MGWIYDRSGRQGFAKYRITSLTNQQGEIMQNIILTLTVDETNTVLSGLSELPAKFSIVLIQKIQQQAQSQLEPKGEENGDSKTIENK